MLGAARNAVSRVRGVLHSRDADRFFQVCSHTAAWSCAFSAGVAAAGLEWWPTIALLALALSSGLLAAHVLNRPAAPSQPERLPVRVDLIKHIEAELRTRAALTFHLDKEEPDCGYLVDVFHSRDGHGAMALWRIVAHPPRGEDDPTGQWAHVVVLGRKSADEAQRSLLGALFDQEAA